jgi:hypothetical protein
MEDQTRQVSGETLSPRGTFAETSRFIEVIYANAAVAGTSVMAGRLLVIRLDPRQLDQNLGCCEDDLLRSWPNTAGQTQK